MFNFCIKQMEVLLNIFDDLKPNFPKGFKRAINTWLEIQSRGNSKFERKQEKHIGALDVRHLHPNGTREFQWKGRRHRNEGSEKFQVGKKPTDDRSHKPKSMVRVFHANVNMKGSISLEREDRARSYHKLGNLGTKLLEILVHKLLGRADWEEDDRNRLGRDANTVAMQGVGCSLPATWFTHLPSWISSYRWEGN